MTGKDNGTSGDGGSKGEVAASVSNLPGWARHALLEKGFLKLEKGFLKLTDLRRARKERHEHAHEKTWLPNGPNPSHVRTTRRSDTAPEAKKTGAPSGRARSVSRGPHTQPRWQPHSRVRSTSETPPLRSASMTPAAPTRNKTRTSNSTVPSMESVPFTPPSPQSRRPTIEEEESSYLEACKGEEEAGGGATESLLLHQVTALMSERQEWGVQKQQLTKEVEQLHELVGYLLEQLQDASATEGRPLPPAAPALPPTTPSTTPS